MDWKHNRNKRLSSGREGTLIQVERWHAAAQEIGEDLSLDKGCCFAGASIGPYQPLDPERPFPFQRGPLDESGMVRLPGGPFLMGCADPDGWIEDGEGPVREVILKPFLLDATTVTNRQFEAFVADTGYITEAETFGWSFVFHLFVPPKIKRKRGASMVLNDLDWWLAVDGACWRKPEGRGSNVLKRWDHPVVHVSWRDAAAYAWWAGKRLPTEAEWEFAARGGLEQKRYAWGDELMPDNRHMCNIWQGQFPDHNSAADGYVGTAPAKSFPRNGYGLYNMSGNVWEWCADWYSPNWHARDVPETRIDPQGPSRAEAQLRSTDQPWKVMRGGSYLCHDSYCNRYRVGARTRNSPDSSTGNCGFRCAASIP